MTLRTRSGLTLAALLSVGPSSGATAQAAFPSDAAIQRLLDQRVAQWRVGGIVLAARAADGHATVFRAGRSGREGVRLDGDTLFEIGSITKTFTAALLADMVIRGEVGLEDPVEKYLPPGMRVPKGGNRRITLVDLATHTAALPALPANIHPRDVSNPYADYTVEMLTQFLASYTLTQDVGARYEYSAVGYGLLGHALGHRLGEPWADALRERVLVPLGMTATTVALRPGRESRLASGRDESGRPVSNWDIPALPAMGALRSSPRVVMDEETRVGLAWQTGHASDRTNVWHGGGRRLPDPHRLRSRDEDRDSGAHQLVEGSG